MRTTTALLLAGTAILRATADAAGAAEQETVTAEKARQSRLQAAKVVALASQYAERFSDKTEADAEYIAVIKEELNAAPHNLEADLRADFGDDFPDGFPIPGTTPENSQNPDKVVEWIRNDNGEYVERNVSFYNLLVEATKKGRSIVAAKLIAKENKQLTPVERRSEINRLNGRLNTVRGNVIKAVNMAQQKARIARMLPNVGVDIIMVPDPELDPATGKPTPGKMMITRSPISLNVYDKTPGQGAVAKGFSVNAFINLDPALASKTGGSVRDLWATARSDEPEDDTATEGTEAASRNILKGPAELANYLSEINAVMVEHKDWLTRLINPKAKDRYDIIDNILKLRDELDVYAKDMKLQEQMDLWTAQQGNATTAGATSAPARQVARPSA